MRSAFDVKTLKSDFLVGSFQSPNEMDQKYRGAGERYEWRDKGGVMKGERRGVGESCHCETVERSAESHSC